MRGSGACVHPEKCPGSRFTCLPSLAAVESLRRGFAGFGRCGIGGKNLSLVGVDGAEFQTEKGPRETHAALHTYNIFLLLTPMRSARTCPPFGPPALGR